MGPLNPKSSEILFLFRNKLFFVCTYTMGFVHHKGCIFGFASQVSFSVAVRSSSSEEPQTKKWSISTVTCVYRTPDNERKCDQGWASRLGEGAVNCNSSTTAPGFIVFPANIIFVFSYCSVSCFYYSISGRPVLLYTHTCMQGAPRVPRRLRGRAIGKAARPLSVLSLFARVEPFTTALPTCGQSTLS